MAIEKFDSIAKAWAEGLERENLVMPLPYGPKVADIMFTAVSEYLSAVKSKDCPSAFVFEEINGNFIMAAILEYHAGKTAKDPGNWSYVWTFDPADIPDTAKKYFMTDNGVRATFTSASLKKYRFSIIDQHFVVAYLFMAKMISKWLTDNAVENDVVGVELPGVFQARVSIEDGAVFKAIEPAGEIKVLIKDDAAIEK